MHRHAAWEKARTRACAKWPKRHGESAGALWTALAASLLVAIVHRPSQLVCVFVGVVVLTACAWGINRIAGLDVPIWTSPKPSPYQEVASGA